MNALSLSALRPRNTSAAAIRDALASISREHGTALQRRDAARANRRSALIDPDARRADIVSFEDQAQDAELEIERLELLAGELEARLAAAIRAEHDAARQQAIEAARATHAAAVAEFRDALPGYVEHADAIAAICRLEQRQAATLLAYQVAVHAAAEIGAAVSLLLDPGCAGIDAALSRRVILPGLPGDAPIWNTTPAPVRTAAHMEAAIYGRGT